MEEFLVGTSFHLSAAGGEDAGPGLAAWGRVARSSFEGDEGGVSVEGSVTSGFLGADVEWDRVLAGAMVSHSRSEGRYRGAEGRGDVESRLTGVYPYARFGLSDRVSLWGLGGMGWGEVTLEPGGRGRLEADVSLYMGALGVAGRVLEEEAEGLGLSVKSDAMWVRTRSDGAAGLAASDSEVTRLRLILEGERGFDLGAAGRLTPRAQAGVRLDGGDAETGVGLELGGGLRYTTGLLTVEGAVRGLAAHEDGGFEEWGASGGVRLAPEASGRGLSLTLAPVWGKAASEAERLWAAGDAGELGPAGDFEPEARLEGELGYGLGLGGAAGVVTPYAGFSASEEESRGYRAGARWVLAPEAALGLEAARSESAGGDGPEHRIGLDLKLRW